MKNFQFLLVLLFFLGCEDEEIIHTRYVDIDTKFTRLKLGGYDGYIETDLEITNTSDLTLNGWEVKVEVTTASYQVIEGIFFRHDIDLTPNATKEYMNNVLFHWDVDYIYPLTLTSNDSTIRDWNLIFARGIVF